LPLDAADLPRIWWCPTGPLAFLPIHAAGIYNPDEPSISLANFAISSYTPTLTALLRASRQKSPEERDFKVLGIAQPKTPNTPELPSTVEEFKHIQKHASKHNLPVRYLEGTAATVQEVLDGMNECPWVHFACHGIQHNGEPEKSALLLQDGPLELLEITKNSLPRADFAFLSACQTATGDVNYPDEAIHIAAGMLLAGYRSVIATMWSIKDSVAPVIADVVYAKLFEGGHPHSDKAALALHHAVQEVRKREGSDSFLSWMPFIHVGV
jgi:CHAT domain-containing protein